MRLTCKKALFMITLKLKTKNEYDVSEYCRNYSGLFHELYFNFEQSADINFIKKVRQKYNFDSWEYQSCAVEVKTKLVQFETNTLKKQKKIEELIAITDFENKRHKHKVMKKIAYLQANNGKDIVFGTKSLIRKISFLSNKTKGQRNNRIRKRLLKKAKLQFKENRILAYTIIGEAPNKGNRKFDFDFINKKVFFKPKNGVKIPIEFHCSKNQYEQLIKLQQQIGEQPISVRLDNNNIWISFDEEKLNGFSFNKNEYKKDLKYIPKEFKTARKECYKRWIKEKELRMFSTKIIGRYIGFDLNPEYIAFVIIDRLSDSDDSFKIIYKECISLKGLNTKLKLNSTDKKQIKQNNKRIHEISCVLKYIFKVAAHFKVSNCAIEDLFFKQELINNKANEANRQTLNIWHRTLTTNLIKKHCNTIGIKLIGVNACYSSFIGNIKHGFFDPVNAAIEVARRGIAKYLGGSFFYPKLEGIDFDTMYRLGLDVQNKNISTWVKAFGLFKKSGLRYRQELDETNFLERDFMSHKSCTILYSFV